MTEKEKAAFGMGAFIGFMFAFAILFLHKFLSTQ